MDRYGYIPAWLIWGKNKKTKTYPRIKLTVYEH